jgi:hypothetical protein
MIRSKTTTLGFHLRFTTRAHDRFVASLRRFAAEWAEAVEQLHQLGQRMFPVAIDGLAAEMVRIRDETTRNKRSNRIAARAWGKGAVATTRAHARLQETSRHRNDAPRRALRDRRAGALRGNRGAGGHRR